MKQEEEWIKQLIPPSVFTPSALQKWLQEYWERHAGREHLFAYARLVDVKGPDAENLVATAQAFSARLRAQRRRVRIFFMFDAKSTWSWLVDDPTRREKLEEGTDALVAPTPWGAAGIRQRLHQLDKMSSDEVCRDILACTGGWPMLLDELFQRARGESDLRPAAQKLYEELAQDSRGSHRRLLDDIGAAPNTIPGRLLTTFHSLVAQSPDEAVPDGVIGPEDIPGQSPIIDEEYQAALKYLLRLSALRTVALDSNSVGYRLDPLLARLPAA